MLCRDFVRNRHTVQCAEKWERKYCTDLWKSYYVHTIWGRPANNRTSRGNDVGTCCGVPVIAKEGPEVHFCFYILGVDNNSKNWNWILGWSLSYSFSFLLYDTVVALRVVLAESGWEWLVIVQLNNEEEPLWKVPSTVSFLVLPLDTYFRKYYVQTYSKHRRSRKTVTSAFTPWHCLCSDLHIMPRFYLTYKKMVV